MPRRYYTRSLTRSHRSLWATGVVTRRRFKGKEVAMAGCTSPYSHTHTHTHTVVAHSFSICGAMNRRFSFKSPRCCRTSQVACKRTRLSITSAAVWYPERPGERGNRSISMAAAVMVILMIITKTLPPLHAHAMEKIANRIHADNDASALPVPCTKSMPGSVSMFGSL